MNGEKEKLFQYIALSLLNVDSTDVNITEFKSNVLDKLTNMEKAIDDMEKSPLQNLIDKLSNIDEQLCKQKAEINKNQTVDRIIHDLYLMSKPLEEKLYDEMVKEFPEIKNVTEDEVTDYLKENDKFHIKFGFVD